VNVHGEYPYYDNRKRLLDFFYNCLQQAYDASWDRLLLMVTFSPKPGVTVAQPFRRNLEKELGLRGGEIVAIFRNLEQEGYIQVSHNEHKGFGMEVVELKNLHDKALLEIGQIPDAQQRFLSGLEAAIRTTQQDDTIPEPEKKRRIDWLEEGKHLARTFTVEVLKGMLRGDIPPM
jgi:DNA-binding MarR family transcriptional regulator